MDARLHRVATALLGSLTGISALLVATDPSALHVSGIVWAWVAVGLSVATVVVTAVRQAWDTPLAVLPPPSSITTTAAGLVTSKSDNTPPPTSTGN